MDPWTAVFLSVLLILCILVSENRAASQAVFRGMVMSERVSEWVSNSCCCYGAAAQSKSLSFCWSSQAKTSPREEQRLHCCLHTAQQCSPWLQGEGFQLFTSSFHYALTCFLLHPLCARVAYEQCCNIRAQVQSYNVFWNVLGRAAVLRWAKRHFTVL